MFIPNRVFIPVSAALLVCASIGVGVLTAVGPGERALLTSLSTAVATGRNANTDLRYLAGCDTGPKLTAHAAILVDVGTRTILFARNAEQRRAPASTTKMLTALVALERGRLTDVVTVSRAASLTRGSTLHLRMGDRLTLESLLTGMLLRSGNDAATAIAQHIAGTTGEFAQLMNARARTLGAARSHFTNAHGLDNPEHYTTAEDLAIIALAAIENSEFARIVRTRAAKVGTAEEAWSKDINNTNQLLWSFEGAEGVKTGTTGAAGKCLVALASRQGRQVMAVILGAPSRYFDAQTLLAHGFDNFSVVTDAEKGELVRVVAVAKGMGPSADLVATSTTQFVVRNEHLKELQLMMHIPSPLTAPLRSGQIVGRLAASVGPVEVASTPLMVSDGVAKRTWWRVVWQWVSIWATDIAKFATWT